MEYDPSDTATSITFHVDSVVRPWWTRASFIPHGVRREHFSLPETYAASLLPCRSSLQSCQWLYHCYHGWKVRQCQQSTVIPQIKYYLLITIYSPCIDMFSHLWSTLMQFMSRAHPSPLLSSSWAQDPIQPVILWSCQSGQDLETSLNSSLWVKAKRRSENTWCTPYCWFLPDCSILMVFNFTI